ncbi:hypothetical protein [Nocardia sp. BMG111209]|uniref:hypothetical protein n=1 Tax=Nocardia sp. BMG111209 TaxID=1160137 RepID=UPI0003716EF7|nr:hypothetical protein [Nocardia sp. BMG111209]
MAGFEQVPEDELAQRWELAERVVSELRRAGLPSSLFGRGEPSIGAVVAVDSGIDTLGGVWVDWRVGADLSAVIHEAVLSRRSDEPALQHFGNITQNMARAIAAILRSAGLRADTGSNEESPNSVSVEN